MERVLQNCAATVVGASAREVFDHEDHEDHVPALQTGCGRAFERRREVR